MSQLEGSSAAAGLLAKLGRGVYTPPEAAHITRLQSRRVRRWLAGYNFKSSGGELRRSGPVFPREHEGAELALTFMDLVEVLYVSAFLDAGVRMKTVRLVHEETAHEFRVRHPFSIKRMETDGKSIFHRFVEQGAPRLLDRKRLQFVERQVFDPLMKRFDYDALTEEAARYWPLGRDKPVMLDPARSFGEAIVNSGVPTRVLHAAHLSGDSRPRIARWYGVGVEEVTAAIVYEESLARAA